MRLLVLGSEKLQSFAAELRAWFDQDHFIREFASLLGVPRGTYLRP